MGTVEVAVCFLSAFAVLSVVQWLMGKQPRPIWTAKAATVVALTILLNAITVLMLRDTAVLVYPLIIVGQPAYLLLAWLLLWPLDTLLKRSILRKAERVRHGMPSLSVIAITGSVGKTTTKELLRCVLNSLFPVVTPDYVNSELGVAKWFLREVQRGAIRPGATLVVEMGAYRTKEVALLCRMLRPQTGIVTGVGTQHIALFGSMEQILQSEREMPSSLPASGLLLLNGDMADCKALAASAPCNVIVAGTSAGCDLLASSVQTTPSGLRITIDEGVIDVPLHGKHNATNVLLAYAAAKAAGLASAEIIRALASFSPLSRTFHVSRQKSVLLLDDTHNSSPQSMAAGIDWAQEQNVSPRVLLTTGIIEQGRQEASVMEEMGRRARGVFDRVIFVGERGRSAFDRGWGNASELPAAAPPLPNGALLACIGRVPQHLVDRLLP